MSDRIQILQGDCIEVMRTLDAGSVHCVVTSPPYWGLRDYGEPGQLGLEPTPEEYVENMVAVFREVRRVLRDDGTVWLNLGDSYANDTKWGGATGGKHANGLHGQTGVGRQKVTSGLKPKDLVGIPWRVAFALQDDGWWLRSDIIWAKPNPMPESVRDRPTRSHEYVFLMSKSGRYYFDQDAVREPHTDESARRYLHNSSYDGDPDATQYAMKNGPRGHSDGRNIRSVWNIPTQPFAEAHFATFPEALVKPCILAGTSEWGCCSECGTPWERQTERVSTGKSYAVEKSEAKRKQGLATAFSGYDDGSSVPAFKTTGWRPTCEHEAPPTPCTVLDPFGGSGTVGVVAQKAGRSAILIDLNPDYVEMMNRRLAQRALL